MATESGEPRERLDCLEILDVCTVESLASHHAPANPSAGETRRADMLRTTRLVLTTGILTAAWMLISAVAALAGDGVPPLPR